jgi:hypothetical protein
MALPKTIYLRGKEQVEWAKKFIEELPLNPKTPIQVIIREGSNHRTREQNDLYWKYVAAISEQVFLKSRSYSKDAWHEYLKREFLPVGDQEKLVKENYQKWVQLPGEHPNAIWHLIGSTTQLTVTGMQMYLDLVIEFADQHGVKLE